MSWNNNFPGEKPTRENRPGRLALFVYNFLKQSRRFQGAKDIFILDISCGYGRDAIFLASNLPCHILGLDSSEKAIEIARSSLNRELEKRVEFLCYDFSRVNDKYDIILASGLYQLLRPNKRAEFVETVKRCLKADGMLFLSTLSVRDPQRSGRGEPVEGDPNSFQQEQYIHLCTREELEKDFDFLNISALFEREFDEPLTAGHQHHISWIMIGSPR